MYLPKFTLCPRNKFILQGLSPWRRGLSQHRPWQSPKQRPLQMAMEVRLSPGGNVTGMCSWTLTSLLMPRVRMSGAIPQQPNMPSCCERWHFRICVIWYVVTKRLEGHVVSVVPKDRYIVFLRNPSNHQTTRCHTQEARCLEHRLYAPWNLALTLRLCSSRNSSFDISIFHFHWRRVEPWGRGHNVSVSPPG